MPKQNEPKQNGVVFTTPFGKTEHLEAEVGIEPAYTALQAAA